MSILIQIPKNLIDTEILSYHYDAQNKYYPDQEIFLVECEEQTRGGNWKNSDKELRNWYRDNSSKIKDEVCYITEFGFVIDESLPELPQEYDLVGSKLVQKNFLDKNPQPSDGWVWWKEAIHIIPHLTNGTAYGLISKGFYVVRKKLLDEMLSEKYDPLYSVNIQNELRFATVASLCGGRLGETKSTKLFPIPELNKILKEQQKNKKKDFGGAGTELARILASFGITAKPNCPCKQRMKTMDTNGIEWCENNIPKIVGWLEEEAKKRKMVFSKTIARIMVKRAIRNARKKQNEKTSNSTSA